MLDITQKTQQHDQPKESQHIKMVERGGLAYEKALPQLTHFSFPLPSRDICKSVTYHNTGWNIHRTVDVELKKFCVYMYVCVRVCVCVCVCVSVQYVQIYM